eukprot:4663163-Amphidinium_carterae.1
MTHHQEVFSQWRDVPRRRLIPKPLMIHALRIWRKGMVWLANVQICWRKSSVVPRTGLHCNLFDFCAAVCVSSLWMVRATWMPCLTKRLGAGRGCLITFVPASCAVPDFGVSLPRRGVPVANPTCR